LEKAANIEHHSLAKLGVGVGGGIFLNDLVERVYVHDKTSLKINGAEAQQRQPIGMFQIGRLFQITRLSDFNKTHHPLNNQ
jgi:hypothetical protein